MSLGQLVVWVTKSSGQVSSYEHRWLARIIGFMVKRVRIRECQRIANTVNITEHLVAATSLREPSPGELEEIDALIPCPQRPREISVAA
jgi:hypothetical protein